MIAFVNPDTVVEPRCLAQPREARLSRSRSASSWPDCACRPTGAPEFVRNRASCERGRLGRWVWGAGASLAELDVTRAPSGAAMAMPPQTFHELGGFAEEFFMYLEDVELGWRARIAGYRVVVDPAADVLHDYDFGVTRGRTTSWSATGSSSSCRPTRLGCSSCWAAARGDRARDGPARAQGAWARDKLAGWAGWCERG